MIRTKTRYAQIPGKQTPLGSYRLGHGFTIWLKVRRQLTAPDLVEDACQETLLRVLRYFRSGKGLDNRERLPAFVWACEVARKAKAAITTILMEATREVKSL